MPAASQIRAIYALGTKLGINRNNREDNLHQLVYSITGKESVKALTKCEAALVQSELHRMDGDNRKERKRAIDIPPGKMSEAQQSKAWRLMYELQEISPSGATVAERMRGAVKKILGMDINTDNPAPFRMVTVAEGAKLIDTLKRYLASARKSQQKAGEGENED